MANARPLAASPVPASVPPVPDSAAEATGLSNLGQQNYAFAAAYFRQATAANPGSLSAWTGYAAALDNLGRFFEADRAYQRMLELGGQTVAYHNNRGFSYMLRGDYRRAAAEFDAALRISPDNETALNNRLLLRELSGGGAPA